MQNKYPMRKVKTSELTGTALDLAVWSTQVDPKTIMPMKGFNLNVPKFSTDWGKGGPLIEKHQVRLNVANSDGKKWLASTDGYVCGAHPSGLHESPLVAACRAIVGSKLGDEVEVPIINKFEGAENAE